MKYPDKIRLYVGKRDIENGKACNGRKCPVGLAVTRKFNSDNISIYAGLTSYIDGINYRICNIGKNFIYAFDQNIKVKPTRVIFTKVK